MTGGTAFFGLFAPGMFVIAGGLAAGFTGLAVGDRQAVKKGLRELDGWGFPVTGYREWLLADEPTFEIDLARDVDLDVLETSAHAIEPSITVVRTRPRTFRFITRRVALPAREKDGPVFVVGDRQLLQLIHQRLLAPLHADVRIVAMRMGHRDRMPAAPLELPASSDVASDRDGDAAGSLGLGAFREAAMAAPPALQELVDMGRTRELPREASKLNDRAARVIYALGSAPHGAGTVIGFVAGGAFSGVGWFHLIGAGVGAVGGLVAGSIAAVQGNRRNARRLVKTVSGHGFPIEGYDLWLISGRPLFDIELATAIDPTWLSAQLERLPRAFSVSASAEVSWVETVEWLDDKLVRIETRPTLVEPASRFAPFYGGSHAMFGTFIEQVLRPLNEHAGVKAVRMGGYLVRRL